MPEIRVSDLAKDIGTSTQSVYRAIKRLGMKIEGHVFSDHGAKVVNEEGQRLIRDVLNCSTVRSVPVTPPTVLAIAPEISNRLEGMEKAILLLVDENRRLSGEVEMLRRESATLHRRLEVPPKLKPAMPRPDPGMLLVKRIEEKPVQRDTASAWEGIRLAFDDLLGLAFGRG